MKSIKKILACVMALATLSSVSMLNVSAEDTDEYYHRYTNDNFADKSLFGTILEKNACDIVSCEALIDSTTLTFKDGFTYTLPQCDELIVTSQVPNQEEECYYILGYVVSCFGLHAYNIGYWEYSKPETVTLPDDTVLNIGDISDCYDIEEVYNLDGKYMGYRIVHNGESGERSDIIYSSSITIGDSESTSITEFTIGESTFPRGDINLDGNVNTVDLLMLKKYLLGLMEW